MANEQKDLSKITGHYTLTGNPCTTTPCLPGMACAVSVNERNIYLTVNDNFLPESQSWDNYTPQVGDKVILTGYLRENIDINGDPYQTLEVVSLKQAE